MPDLLIGFIAMLAVLIPTCLYWGWILHDWRHPCIKVNAIDDYIQSTLPTEWAAYEKGVHEGYEQGLRDGQATT